MPDTQSAIQWYIQVTEGKKAGPTTFERLQQFVKSGKIKPDTKVRNTQPDSVWVLAETIPGLFDDVTESATAEPAPTETSVAETPAAEAVAVTTEPAVEPEKTEKKGSSIAPFKINIGGGNPSAPKPETVKKPAFKIDTKAAAKPAPKEEKAAKEPEKVAEKIEQPKPEEKPVSQPEKKAEKKPSDKSSVAVKIAFGAPKSKDEKKPSDKSSLFKISTKPAPKEEEAAKEKTVPVESTESADDLEALPTEDIVEEPAAKKTEKKEKSVQKSSSKKKIATIPLLLIVTAVFSLLVGLGGGLTLAFLSSEKVGPGFSAMLGIVVFLFGALLGVVSLLLALLFNRQAEN